jgi:hypothetical protein
MNPTTSYGTPEHWRACTSEVRRIKKHLGVRWETVAEAVNMSKSKLLGDLKRRPAEWSDLLDKLAGAFAHLDLRSVPHGEKRRAYLDKITQSVMGVTNNSSEGQQHNSFVSAAEQLQIAGDWIIFYVEDDTLTDPYLVEEHVKIIQYGDGIEGEYTTETVQRPSNFKLKGKVSERMIYGRYFVPGRPGLRGLGFFQLLANRGDDDWFEGYCTWYDADSSNIESSKNIWIRTQAFFWDTYLQDAKRIMNTEAYVFSARKKRALG